MHLKQVYYGANSPLCPQVVLRIVEMRFAKLLNVPSTDNNVEFSFSLQASGSVGGVGGE